MLPAPMKKYIERFITNECDDIIIDIMAEKLDVNIERESDNIKFTVKFANKVIAEDVINIK